MAPSDKRRPRGSGSTARRAAAARPAVSSLRPTGPRHERHGQAHGQAHGQTQATHGKGASEKGVHGKGLSSKGLSGKDLSSKDGNGKDLTGKNRTGKGGGNEVSGRDRPTRPPRPSRGRRVGGPRPFVRGSSRRLVVMGAVLVLLAIMLVPTARAYLAQRDANAALTAKVARQEQTVAQLRRDIDMYANPDYVERQARDRLGWVKPGETAWRIVGLSPAEGGGIRNGMAIPANPEGTIPYYERMWASILIADRAAPGQTSSGTRPLAPVGDQPSATPTESPSQAPSAALSNTTTNPSGIPTSAATSPAISPTAGPGQSSATGAATGGESAR